jgi:hypothetical protein
MMQEPAILSDAVAPFVRQPTDQLSEHQEDPLESLLAELPAPARAIATSDFDVVSGSAAAVLPPVTATATVTVSPPLRAARAELARLNATLSEASAALETANVPVARLRQVEADLQRREEDVRSQRSRFDSIVGSWMSAGAKDERPAPPPSLVESERELAAVGEDARVARHTMPQLEAEAQAAAQLVNEIAGRRNKALIAATIETVRQFCTCDFAEALATYRRCEFQMRCIEDALSLRGEHAAAQQIAHAIRALKYGARPKDDPQHGASFLARLLADPMTATIT